MSAPAVVAAPYRWPELERDLDSQGNAVLQRLISPEECGQLAALYDQEDGFRSRIVMARHGFGRGEYKYFEYPLPPLIAELRSSLYRQLAPIANRWNQAMNVGVQYPDSHSEFLERCHQADPLFQRAKPITLFGSLKSFTFRLWDEQRRKLVSFRQARETRSASGFSAVSARNKPPRGGSS